VLKQRKDFSWSSKHKVKTVGFPPTPDNLFEKRLNKNFSLQKALLFAIRKFLKGVENFFQKVFCGFDFDLVP